MAAETSDIRAITRRVKKLALEKAEAILKNPNDPLYKETFQIVLKNSVPQTRELTGEDGEAINVKVVNYGNSIAASIPAEGVPITVT